MAKHWIALLFCLHFSHSLAQAQTFSPNVRIHPNPASFQFEPSIATDPSTSRTILVAASVRNNERSRIGWYYSTDFGQTWIGRDTLPVQTDFGDLMVDPAADIDLDGNLFVSGIHKGIFAARSTDGGLNWSHVTVGTPGRPERPHLTADRSPVSPHKNNVYVAYTDIRDPLPGPIFFSRSTDHGQTFSAPTMISGDINLKAALGVNLEVDADGLLCATWSGFDGIPFVGTPPPFHLGFNTSSDGGATWGIARSLRMVEFNYGAHGVSFFNHPTIAIDRSNGSRRGWLYIAFAERTGPGIDIFLTRSSDHGVTWSCPMRVNQDSDLGRDQWQPWIAVDPATGRLFVAYIDCRNAPNNDSLQVYVSASIDGGNTFRDFLASDTPFVPTAVQQSPPIVPQYMGSYIGITALGDTLLTVWNDNRSGLILEGARLHQIYASHMTYVPYTGAKGIFSTRIANLGKVRVGSMRDSAIVITNYGDADLAISSISSSDPAFSVRPSTGTVSPGASRLDTVRYAPAADSRDSAWIYFAFDNDAVRDSIRVMGEGYTSPVAVPETMAPEELILLQNYPNPFNPVTKIRYHLPPGKAEGQAGISGFALVRLAVYDLLGREVALLANDRKAPGTYEARFDASGLPGGVYFYRLTAGTVVLTRRMILIR